MNLSYTIPNAEEYILSGVKIHTLRQDRGSRWKQGNTIHHCYSFRHKNGYRCFLQNTCTNIQQVLLVMVGEELTVNIDRRRLNKKEISALVDNDGLPGLEFFLNWFFPIDQKGGRTKTMWAGKIIHWTNLKY